ncbi:hypothetical protein [Halorubrum sp. Eb13]|uniref:hypothetical protein n=1 Tax=Halorubrum sp. Eb13 TaxID=1383843 RepID=UPI001595A4FF|nr:hypothetical protein [Halorubrum sp. Eb13]
MKRRNLILLLGGASSGAMSVGTGAFSSMEAERGVEVSVEDDEDAFVRYRSSKKTVSSNTTINLVEIRNQFGDDTEIEIEEAEVKVTEIEGNGPTLVGEPVYPEEKFGQWDGDQVIIGEVTCGEESGKSQFEVTVRVRGDGVQAELFGETRSFIVECDPLTVEFAGEGSVFVSPSDLELNTRVLYSHKGDRRVEPSDGPFLWETSQSFDSARPKGDFMTKGQLIAVRFTGCDET